MFCTSCGTQIEDGARFCSRCGKATDVASPPGHILPANVAHPMMQSTQMVIMRSGKNAGLAAVMSALWCGLGQIYNGQIGKGVGMMFAYAISVLLMFVIVGFLTTPILWIWGMVDAYRTSERLNVEAGLA